MDYVFNVENQVPLEEAVLICVLLLDLQEDYRYAVKRAFLRYILQYK